MVKGKESKTTKKASKVTANVPSKKEEDVDSVDEDSFLDPEDLEYFQDSRRSFAFLQDITAE